VLETTHHLHPVETPANMRQTVIAAMIAALMCCSAVQAAPPSITDVLEKNGYTLFTAFLKAVGAYDKAKMQRKITVLAPTDEAIKTFLSKMGMTTQDALARPGMLDAILSYHIIPYVKGTSSRLEVGKPVIAGTGNPKETVEFIKGKDGSVIVTDLQDNEAKVVKADMDAGLGIVHGIDKVLMNDRVYFTLADALAGNKQWDTLTGAAKSSGFVSALKDPKTSITLFAPNNGAFKAVPNLGSLPKETVVGVLKYHAVPGYKEIKDLKSGESLGTLDGNKKVTVTVNTKNETKGIVIRSVFIAPESGSKGRAVSIGRPNIWAGKSIIHGVNGVLLPAAGASATSGRKLQGRGRSNNWNSYGDDLSYQQSSASRATASAIEASASGDIPAGYATAVGSVTASAVGSSCSNCWNCYGCN